MALTRKLLKSLSLSDEAQETIIEAHTETVGALKDEINTLKGQVEGLPALTKERDYLKKEIETLKANGGDTAKVQAEFDAYKKQIEGEKKAALDEADVMAICKEAGIARESSLRLIVKDFDRSQIERGDDGKITNRAKLVEAVKKDYADFVGTPGKDGTPPATPPTGGGGGMTKEQILDIKDAKARQQAIADNMELFNRK